MTEPISPFNRILDLQPVSRIRRNHGLEHATLSILAQRHPGLSLAGHSNLKGFWVIGDVSTEAIQQAVEEALSRLRNGERRLAIHPNCGTNFVTSGTLAGMAGAAAMFGVGPRWRDRVERLPLAAIFATLALIIAYPLAIFLQMNVTTSGDPGDLAIIEILCVQRGRITAHRITTRG